MSRNRSEDGDFDYVVVGAGSAGCVLAARLAADPDVRVAVLEAGAPDTDPELRVPLHSIRQFGSTLDWGWGTVPQPGLGGRVVHWPRGKVVGGSSTMNFQMWVPGYRRDYDDWVAAAGPEWSWERMHPVLRGVERWAGDPASSGFGTAGEQWISPPVDPDPSTLEFLAGCRAAGLPEFPSGLADPRGEGSALAPLTQRAGARFSAADAFLRPAVRGGRVTVRTDMLVRSVRWNRHGRACGVDTDRGTITARREVILCAGTIGSPQLLLASGVGPAAQLAAAGIPVRADVPAVGANLHDHVIVNLAFAVVGPDRFAAAGTEAARELFDLSRRGPLTSNIGEAVAFVGSAEAPEAELIWSPIAFGEQGLVSGRTLSIVLLRPESRGRLEPGPPGRAARLRIDPAYLTEPADVATLRSAYRRAREVLTTAEVSAVVGAPLSALPDDGEVTGFLRATATTLFHPVGTCRIGRAGDAAAVVDEQLRVRGVDGLRVADASVVPRSPRGHTNAHAILIGARAAQLIRASEGAVDADVVA